MSATPPPAPRPLTGGAAMSAASRIVVATTGAATTILVARLLGPAGSGGFAVAQTLILVLAVAATLGVPHGIAYYVSSGRWPAPDAFRTSQRVALASGALAAVLGVLARLAFPSAFGGLALATTVVAAAAVPFALAWTYATFVALARDRYEAYAVPPALQSALALALVAVLAAFDGLRGAVIGFSLAHVLTAASAWIAGRRALRRAPRVPAGRGQLRRAVRFGLKGYTAGALQLLNYRLDVFVLAAVASAADVGQYAVAMAVTGVMLLLPGALSDVLFPRVAALSAMERDTGHEARAFVETKSLRHVVILVTGSALVLALALVLLVVPVYGAGFRPAIELGLILLPGVACLALAGPLAASFVGRGHPGLSLAIALVTTPITIGLYVVLIPELEAPGAALASTASYAITFALSALANRRVTGVPVMRRLVPTRSELADYRALAPAIRAWVVGLRRRDAGAGGS